ncbi:MAG: acetoacetyl-CoA reductase [Proteobacteria bacterium]|nr:acetoacetyl-CoA reductase [Pseudomonadota bacterium]MBW3617260.1 acetoacetyl-CoA reductase [Pseudomonadota bacterium]
MARTALVTGGTRGIGRAIVERLKQDGFKVAAGYSGNDEAARATAAELDVTVVKGNVGSFEDARRAVGEVEAELGPVEVLVNNAGITRDGFFHKMTPEQWGDVIRVNMDSVFNMTRQVIEGMRERSFGRIINISSINGQKGQVGQTNYSAAKAGMIGFTKALALETARKGITVNCVAPGYIGTEMVAAVPENVLQGIVANIPVGRLGEAEEIAAVVAFLARDDASFITGATLGVNGGQYMVG